MKWFHDKCNPESWTMCANVFGKTVYFDSVKTHHGYSYFWNVLSFCIMQSLFLLVPSAVNRALNREKDQWTTWEGFVWVCVCVCVSFPYLFVLPSIINVDIQPFSYLGNWRFKLLKTNKCLLWLYSFFPSSVRLVKLWPFRWSYSLHCCVTT